MLHIKEEHKQTMDVSMDWRDRQQSSERQRLEYGEQSTWEEKKMQKKIPKICTDTLESLTDCKAAHKLGVKYMRQSKEWQLRKKKKNTLEFTQDWKVSKFYLAKGRNLIEHLRHARGPLEILYLRSKANLAPKVKIILDAF